MEEGDGNRTGTAKHLICKDEKRDKVFHSNIKGNFEYLKEILDNKEEYIGKYATIKYFQLIQMEFLDFHTQSHLEITNTLWEHS